MLAKEDVTRLIQLLGMMGSDHDGEVLNAARLAQRVLTDHKLQWGDVIGLNGSAPSAPGGANRAEGGGGGKEDVEIAEKIRTAYNMGFRDGVNHRAQQRAEDWRTIAQDILDEGDITAWEETFFMSFASGVRRVPTEKQQSIFERVAHRLGIELPG